MYGRSGRPLHPAQQCDSAYFVISFEYCLREDDCRACYTAATSRNDATTPAHGGFTPAVPYAR